MVAQPARRREKLSEGRPLGNLALLRLPAVSAGIQVLVEDASHVTLVKGIGLGFFGDFFGFRFQKGLVAVVVGLSGFFTLLLQRWFGAHLRSVHFAELRLV